MKYFMNKAFALLVVLIMASGLIFAGSGNTSSANGSAMAKSPLSMQVKKKKKKKRSGYIMGPRGGCYYRRGKNKVYVSKSLCR